MTFLLTDDLRKFVGPVSKKPRTNVVEIFSAIQGEGMFVGQPTIFLRLGGCDYRCLWCDSMYAVDPIHREEWVPMTPEEILAAIQSVHPDIRHITLSGGNPAIHALLGTTINLLSTTGYQIAIETQGTIFPSWAKDIDFVTLSPKPPSSGNETDATHMGLQNWILSKQIQVKSKDGKTAYAFYEDICLKVVVFDEADYLYAKRVHKKYPELLFYFQTGTVQREKESWEDAFGYLQRTRNQVLKATNELQAKVLADTELNLINIRVVPQMHTLIYGLGRGF